MKKWLFITAAIVGTIYSFNAFASPNCRFHAPIDGDNSITEMMKGHPGEDTYSYLVKRDFFGDGTNFVLYPIYSKDWLLTAGKLRDIVARDKANVIGDMDVPVKITVVQKPDDIKDFKPMESEDLVCAD